MMVLVLMLAHSLLDARASYGTYLIKLKNGREFITSRYWQEGQQIMFDTYGGVFGIEKDFVIKVERSNRPFKVEAAPLESAKEPEEIVKAEGSATRKKSQDSASSQDTKTGDDPIFKEFAALKDRSRRIQSMLTDELRRFMTDLVNVKNKARQSAKVNDYNRELAEVNVMADEVEAALKSRGQ